MKIVIGNVLTLMPREGIALEINKNSLSTKSYFKELGNKIVKSSKLTLWLVFYC